MEKDFELRKFFNDCEGYGIPCHAVHQRQKLQMEKDIVTTIGFVCERSGDWPFEESVVNKVWKHSIELLKNNYNIKIYKSNVYNIDAQSEEFKDFINDVDLLWFLSPYFILDRTKKIPAIIYAVGSMQKGGYWLHFNKNSFLKSDSLVFNCSSCQSIYDSIVINDPMLTCTIPFGVDRKIFYPRNKAMMRRKYNIPSSGFVLVYAGRLSPEKNIDVLLRIFKVLISRGKNANLVLVGKVDDYHIKKNGKNPLNTEIMLKNFLKDKELASRVSLLGYQQDPVIISEIMSAADLGINLTLSIGENFGYSQIEYQASGIPVVCSDHAALKDTVIHGKTGYRIKTVKNKMGISLKEEQAISYIEELMDNPSTLELFSRNALLHSKNYSLDLFKSNLIDLVEKTLHGNVVLTEKLDPKLITSVKDFYNRQSTVHGDGYFYKLTSLPFPSFFSDADGDKLANLIYSKITS